MKTLIHLSDIHFGMTEETVINALVTACERLRPDIVIISGDLTQRARVSQFDAARAFIKNLKEYGSEVIAVPGNHDIAPYYRPVARALNPYDRYEEYVAPHVSERFGDSDVAVCGVTTSRPSRIKEGRISEDAVDAACAWFGKQKAVVNLVVTHHPLDLPGERDARLLAQGAERAMAAFERVPVDIYLSGHHHQSSLVHTSARRIKTAHNGLAIQAGTVSTRGRGEAQSFNVLRISSETVEYIAHQWIESAKAFTAQQPRSFVRKESGWQAVD